jgi:hypothetical protein
MEISRINLRDDNGPWPRALNALIGLWLLISAFAWPHSSVQLVNAAVVGVLVMLAAGIAAFVLPEARFANTALGIWLFMSALASLGTYEATTWNNIVVGGIVVLLSLVPGTAAQGHGIHLRHSDA